MPTRPTPPPALPDHYAALGVDETASHLTIRAAHRRILRQTHPDVTGGDPAATRRAAVANAAWTVLSDPRDRAEYDRRRAAQRTPSAARRTGSAEDLPSWGPGGARPVTVAQLREAAARESAYSAVGRAQRAAFSAASWRVGLAIVLVGAAVLALFALA